MNKSCIAKLQWKIKSGDTSLWYKVMRQKYARNNTLASEVDVRVHDSSLWKHIINV